MEIFISSLAGKTEITALKSSAPDRMNNPIKVMLCSSALRNTEQITKL